jgi:hypothetical protein
MPRSVITANLSKVRRKKLTIAPKNPGRFAPVSCAEARAESRAQRNPAATKEGAGACSN